MMADLQHVLAFEGRWKIKPLTTVLPIVQRVTTMAISDANKALMLECKDAVATLVRGLLLTSPRRSEDGANAVQEACAALLLSLALHKPWAEALRADEGAMCALHTLLDAGTEASRGNAESTLFELEGRKALAASSSSTVAGMAAEGLPKHVFISYCWDQQAVIKRVHAALKSRAYRTWIDIEQMMGSTVDAMAGAVENAEVVLIGVSREHKESTNCRLEAQYAMQREVPTVPLMLTDGYRADGWLGMLIGTRMWYGFYGAVLTDETAFATKVSELCRELGDRGRCEAQQSSVAASVDSDSATTETVDMGGSGAIVADSDTAEEHTAVAALREQLRAMSLLTLQRRA
eukprot:SAG22_NODE_2298_length_2742_cov_2.665910_2_plen_346_part_01